jgi:TPP-dependent pyruvate/acetoin dehydrogenase alpha subunit
VTTAGFDAEASIATLREASRALDASGPTPFPLPVDGLEPLIAGAVSALRSGDWYLPGLRERVGAVLRDAPVDRLTDGFAGARPYRVAPPTTGPADRAVYAVGIALSDPERAVLVHLGLGSASDGAFYEGLNAARLTDAPVVFLVAVPSLEPRAGLEPPVARQTAAGPEALATALGIPATSVDGTDATAVHDAVHAAIALGGPHLVSASL